MSKGSFIGVGEGVIRLPPGYKEVEYLESTGKQYINTGAYPSGSNFRVCMKFRYIVSHSALSLFGNSSSRPYSITIYSTYPVFYVGDRTAFANGPQTTLDTDYELDVTASNGILTAIWNGAEHTDTYTGSLFTSRPVFIFGANGGGYLVESDKGYRLYYFQIYNDGVLVRDLLPCINPDGKAGMYDIANGVFYPNAGTGEFVIGPEVKTPVAEEVDAIYIGIGEGRGVNLVDMRPFEIIDSTKYSHTFYRASVPAVEDFVTALSKYVGQTATYSAQATGEKSGVEVGHMRAYKRDGKSLMMLNSGNSFTVPDLTELYYITIYGSANGATVKNMQIELGDVATEYEPYGLGSKAQVVRRVYIGDENGIAQVCYSANPYFVPADAVRFIAADGKIFECKE